MNKEDFRKLLDEGLMKYGMSESCLARGVGIPQKSMNRYRNGQTEPKDETKQKILEYFRALDGGHVKPGEKAYLLGNGKYVSEKELREMELEESSAHDPLDDVKFVGVREFMALPLRVQDYVLRNFYLFCHLARNCHDKEFLERTHALGSSWAELKAYLEAVPISYWMVAVNEVYEEANAYYYVASTILDKVREFAGIQGMDDGLDLDRKNANFEIEQIMNRKKYETACEDYFLATGGDSVPENLLQTVEETIKFRRDDWYLLFLLYRVKLMDEGDFDCRNYITIKEGHRVKAREYAVWTYLHALELNEE